MNRKMMLCGVAAASLMLPACATITRGTSQKFNIESSPTEANAKLSTGQTCTTPCTLTLKRKSQFVVTVSKDGYKSQEVEVHGKIKGGGAAGFAGNAIFGGLIGAGVDAASGASMSLEPNPLKVTLAPVEQASAGTPEAAPEATASTESAALAPAADAVTAAPAADAAPATASEPAPAAEAAPSASPTGGQ